MQKSVSFNRGFNDGVLSKSLTNPIHNNWQKSDTGGFVHHNQEYLKGYLLGYDTKGNNQMKKFELHIGWDGHGECK